MFFLSCSKEWENIVTEPGCAKVYLVSEKYNSDTILLRKDTLWKDLNLCGFELLKIASTKDQWFDFRGCPAPIPSFPEFRIEKLTYILR